MSDLHDTYAPEVAPVADMALDRGLRSYMLGIYNKVGLGLVLAAAIAYATASVPEIRDLLFRTTTTPGAPRLAGLTSLGSLVVLSPLVILLFANLALRRPSALSTGALYWSIVALIGASLGVVVLAFTGASITATFAASAAAFGGLSLVGYTTRRDLTGVGSFMIMGLIGVLAALAINLFLQSPAVQFAASCAGVMVFAGLIAYDTQRLKMAYYQLGGDRAALGVATNFGALSLFINFINLFQLLLMLMSGDRR